MSYITNSLSQGEEVCLRIHLHWLSFVDEWVFTFITIFLVLIYEVIQPMLVDSILRYECIGLIALTVLWSLHKWIDVLSIEMVATNRRVIYKKGLFSVVTSEILISKIESVTIDQSVMGRILGYADLHFSGTGTAHTTFYNIKNPQKVKSEIEYIISQQNRWQ